MAITVTLIMRWLNLEEFGGVFDKSIYKQFIFPNLIICMSIVYDCLMAIKNSNYYHCNVYAYVHNDISMRMRRRLT